MKRLERMVASLDAYQSEFPSEKRPTRTLEALAQQYALELHDLNLKIEVLAQRREAIQEWQRRFYERYGTGLLGQEHLIQEDSKW